MEQIPPAPIRECHPPLPLLALSLVSVWSQLSGRTTTEQYCSTRRCGQSHERRTRGCPSVKCCWCGLFGANSTSPETTPPIAAAAALSLVSVWPQVAGRAVINPPKPACLPMGGTVRAECKCGRRYGQSHKRRIRVNPHTISVRPQGKNLRWCQGVEGGNPWPFGLRNKESGGRMV